VTSFSVATDRRWTDASGQQQQRTVWFHVAAWRRLAEICNQYLAKGRLVFIEGELAEPKPFQGRDGQWRASLEVTAQNVQFLGGKESSDNSTGVSDKPDEVGLDQEEIPFR
jgi:single-strand DNA-binding protein